MMKLFQKLKLRGQGKLEPHIDIFQMELMIVNRYHLHISKNIGIKQNHKFNVSIAMLFLHTRITFASMAIEATNVKN